MRLEIRASESISGGANEPQKSPVRLAYKKIALQQVALITAPAPRIERDFRFVEQCRAGALVPTIPGKSAQCRKRIMIAEFTASRPGRFQPGQGIANYGNFKIGAPDRIKVRTPMSLK